MIQKFYTINSNKPFYSSLISLGPTGNNKSVKKLHFMPNFFSLLGKGMKLILLSHSPQRINVGQKDLEIKIKYFPIKETFFLQTNKTLLNLRTN